MFASARGYRRLNFARGIEKHIRRVPEGSEKGSQSLYCVGNDVKEGDSRKICITFTCEKIIVLNLQVIG